MSHMEANFGYYSAKNNYTQQNVSQKMQLIGLSKGVSNKTDCKLGTTPFIKCFALFCSSLFKV